MQQKEPSLAQLKRTIKTLTVQLDAVSNKQRTADAWDRIAYERKEEEISSQIDALQKQIEQRDVWNKRVQFAAASALMLQGDFHRAAAHIRTLVKDQPQYAAFWNDVGRALRGAERRLIAAGRN